ncbi:MAG: hypothetical protein ACLTMP_02210 [Eggerthella lenta]
MLRKFHALRKPISTSLTRATCSTSCSSIGFTASSTARTWTTGSTEPPTSGLDVQSALPRARTARSGAICWDTAVTRENLKTWGAADHRGHRGAVRRALSPLPRSPNGKPDTDETGGTMTRQIRTCTSVKGGGAMLGRAHQRHPFPEDASQTDDGALGAPPRLATRTVPTLEEAALGWPAITRRAWRWANCSTMPTNVSHPDGRATGQAAASTPWR